MKKRPRATRSSDFAEKVRAVVRAIPQGQTMPYGEVARRAGFPNAARAVGTLMANNYDSAIPCHRVIRSDGKVGAYNRGGQQVKYALLKKEGAVVRPRR